MHGLIYFLSGYLWDVLYSCEFLLTINIVCHDCAMCFVLDVHTIQMKTFDGEGFIVTLNGTIDRTLDIRRKRHQKGERVYAGTFTCVF